MLGRKALDNAEKLSMQIVDAIEKYDLDGVNVDIENVTEQDRKNYNKLVKLLSEKLPEDKSVVVSVAANPYEFTSGWQASYDYETLGQYADYLMIMAYDEHYEGGTAGPVASAAFVEDSLKYAVSKVPKDKIVLGIPFYGRYWKHGESYGGKAVSLEKMSEILENYENNVTYDRPKTPMLQVLIRESDEKMILNGESLAAGTYEFWYENQESIQDKLELVEKYDVKGVGSWKLGLEEPEILDVIKDCMITEKDFFKDVNSSYWAYEEIKVGKESGIIVGKGDDYFMPEDLVTRAELATMVSRVLEKEEIRMKTDSENNKKVCFEDIKGHWAENEIEQLADFGIVNGYEDGAYKPDNYVSRAEVAKIMYKLMDLSGQKSEGVYKDVGIGYWATKYINTLSGYGVLNGYLDGTFRPDNCITRAEMTKIIYKICKI